VRFHPSAGLLDQTFHCYLASDAEHIGAPTSVGEAAEVAWVSRDRVVELLGEGEITDGLTVTALYAWLYHSEADARAGGAPPAQAGSPT
jgi:hypothetical protein